MSDPIKFAVTSSGAYVEFFPLVANRHGLITGATGTGKTVTLQMLADRLVIGRRPVFVADVKGDLSGMASAGSLTPKLGRLKAIGATAPPWSATKAAAETLRTNPGLDAERAIGELAVGEALLFAARRRRQPGRHGAGLDSAADVQDRAAERG